jgi:hypothetical protein
MNKGRFIIRWRAIAVFSGYIGYKGYHSWQRLTSMDAAGMRDEDILKEIADCKNFDIIVGKKKNKDQKRFESDIINLIESLRGKDYEQAYSNGINLLAYYDKNSPYKNDDPMRLSLLLPHLYYQRTKLESVFRSDINTKEAEAAAHYAHYTRELCLSYLLRSGSYMSWLSHAAKDDLFSVALSIGLTYIIAPAKKAIATKN